MSIISVAMMPDGRRADGTFLPYRKLSQVRPQVEHPGSAGYTSPSSKKEDNEDIIDKLFFRKQNLLIANIKNRPRLISKLYTKKYFLIFISSFFRLIKRLRETGRNYCSLPSSLFLLSPSYTN